ncbi:MAG: exodeoxyribonuclease VII small subunit [Cyanobacteria bacterium P01_A01_bin.114]
MPKAKKPAKDWNYETAVAQVGEIIDQLETGEMPLAKVFEQFAQAVEQLQQCDAFLKEKQASAKLLIETLSDD